MQSIACRFNELAIRATIPCLARATRRRRVSASGPAAGRSDADQRRPHPDRRRRREISASAVSRRPRSVPLCRSGPRRRGCAALSSRARRRFPRTRPGRPSSSRLQSARPERAGVLAEVRPTHRPDDPGARGEPDSRRRRRTRRFAPARSLPGSRRAQRHLRDLLVASGARTWGDGILIIDDDPETRARSGGRCRELETAGHIRTRRVREEAPRRSVTWMPDIEMRALDYRPPRRPDGGPDVACRRAPHVRATCTV